MHSHSSRQGLVEVAADNLAEADKRRRVVGDSLEAVLRSSLAPGVADNIPVEDNLEEDERWSVFCGSA